MTLLSLANDKPDGGKVSKEQEKGNPTLRVLKMWKKSPETQREKLKDISHIQELSLVIPGVKKTLSSDNDWSYLGWKEVEDSDSLSIRDFLL